ncbi:MAG: Hpt domain-containing protein [Candidatus Rokuibacteriota bacterium]
MDRAAEHPVDLAVAMRWLGGDRRLLSELVGIFVDDGPKRLQAIRAALTEADVRQVEHVAHNLKGSAAILGATRLQTAALALEDAAHEGHTENGPDLVARVAGELDRVIAFFADPAWTDRLDLEATT